MDLIIFGGTGDLAHKKLYPAIYSLYKENKLPKQLKLTALGTKSFDDSSFLNRVFEDIRAHSDEKASEENFPPLRYISGDAKNLETYKKLMAVTRRGRKIFYLAVMPELFESIIKGLGASGLAKNARVIVEKPFGHDSASAERINRIISEAFCEDHIYRIDHYLGKEMTMNITALRFANAIFEPFLNSRYVDNIQVSICEESGAAGRGRYYDNAGAIKDMIQNHILQLLSLALIEKPESLDPSHIAKEKVKILRSLQLSGQLPVIGQYEGYRDEKDVSADSTTETYAALKLGIDSERWRGTDIYVRTGKKLKNRFACIVYVMRNDEKQIYDTSETNRLVMLIQPSEGVSLSFNLKKPGTGNDIGAVSMDFCQTCRYGPNTPEAYEKLLYDVFMSDKASFTTWEEVKYSWALADEITAAANIIKKERLLIYTQGSKGPTDGFDMAGGWYDVPGNGRQI